MPHDPTRRRDILRHTPAEQAIRAAMQAVEAAGASPHLTRSVTLLDQAAEALADHVDAVPDTSPPRPGDPIVMAYAGFTKDAKGKRAPDTGYRPCSPATGDPVTKEWYCAGTAHGCEEGDALFAYGRYADADHLINLCVQALADRLRRQAAEAGRDLDLLAPLLLSKRAD